MASRSSKILPDKASFTQPRTPIKHNLYPFDDQFKALACALPIGLSLMNRDLTFEYLNPEFTNIFGYTLKDLPDKTVWFKKAYPDQVCRKKMMKLWRQDIAYSSRNKCGYSRELTVRCKNGKGVVVNIRSVFLADGKQLLTYQDITERRQQEEAVQQSEQKFNRAFFNNPVAMSITGFDDGRMVEVNEFFLKNFGFTRREVIGKTSRELGLFKDWNQREMILKKVKQYGYAREVEVIFNSRTRGARSGLYYAEPFKIGDDNFLLSVFNDITERKMLAESLKSSEEKFRMIVETANEGICVFDGQYRIIFVNAQLLRMTGYQKKELLGHKLDEFTYPEDLADLEKRRKARKAGKEERYERRLKLKGGRSLWTLISATPVISGNKFKGSVAMITDISALKKAEEILAGSTRQWKDIFEAVGHSMVIISPDRTVMAANTATIEASGLPGSRIIGKKCYNIFHDKRASSPPPGCPLAKMLSSGKIETAEMEVELLNRYCLVTCTPVFDENGKLEKVIHSAIDITKRKKAEKELQKREAVLRSLLDATPAGVALLVDRMFMKTNSALCRITGYSSEELAGQCTRILYPDEEVYRHVGVELYRKMREEGVGAMETSLRRKDGSHLDVMLCLSPFDPKNFSAGVTATVLDITEFKRVEHALRDSESRYRTIFENTGAATVIINEDKTLLLVNSEFEQMSGYSKAEIEGKVIWTKFVVKEDLDRMITQHEVRRIDEAAALKKYEFRLKTRFGNIRDILISVDMIPETKRCVASLIDITERKNAEAALRESERRWQFALEGAGEGVWDWDSQSNLVVYSSQWKHILGYRDDEIGNTLDEWEKRIHPDDKEAVLKVLEKHLRGETQIYVSEHRVQCKDGSYKWILDRGKVLTRTPEGKPLRVIGTHSDITGRKEAEEMIRFSLREKEVLLREVNHRVKNNLQIINSLYNLQAEKIKDRTVKDILKEAHSRVKSIALVHEKLYQSRDLHSVNLQEYISSLVMSIAHTFNLEEGRVAIKIDVASGVDLGIDKIISCGLIINEVVTNAVKYAFPDGRKGKILIEVKSDTRQKGAILLVSDDGIGLPPGFDINKSSTLGLELMQSLGTQLGSFHLEGKQGTVFTISINE